jgi:hypothetical protein
MAKMGLPEISTILEECINQLQAGKSLEEILAQYPYYVNELRTLLETAAGMRSNQVKITPRDEAMARSRRLFVTQVSLQTRRQSVFHSLHLRLAVTFAIVIFLVVGLLSTGLGSASALPGDTLYPVKLALEQVQLILAAGPVQRLKLLEDFDQVRSQEVNQLKTTDRMITVTFTGVPSQSKEGWMVAGVKLNVTGPEAERLANWQDFVVQVTGETEGEKVNVTDVQRRVLTFNGIIQEISSGAWFIGGIKVKLDSNTDINGTGTAGQRADVSAQRQDDGQLLALKIDIHRDNDAPVSRRSPIAEETSQGPSSTVENSREPRSTDDDHLEATPRPSSESTRLATDSEDRQKHPPTLSPTAPNRTPEPTVGQNEDEHKRTPTPVPSETHLETTPTRTRDD